MRPYEAVYNRMVRRAAARQKACDVTYEEFVEYTKILTCTYCRGGIEWEPRSSWRRKISTRYNLDRVDSGRGYSLDNIVVCCSRCNLFKSSYIPYAAMLEIGPILERYNISYGAIARIAKGSQLLQ